LGVLFLIFGKYFLNQKVSIKVQAEKFPLLHEELNQSTENITHHKEQLSKEEIKIPKNVKTQKVIDSNPVIMLNELNFEQFIKECFEGKPCSIEGDPWNIYRKFKASGQSQITDSYLSFLRKQLKDPKYREQYKEPLLKMIEDFYPPEKIDFQKAAYYNYMGELETSLNYYLDLDNKAKLDPKIFNAPKMNIANTYYDLGRFKEALSYYEAALNDPKNSNSLDFIYNRIDEVKKKLNN
jgi:tetratricopeptide (TPR) repeat protein